MAHLLERQREMDYYERQAERLRLNNLNREEIAAFSAMHAETWLGRVGFHGRERDLVASGRKSPLWRYDGSMVYDCQYDFCIPANDSEMLELIRRWNSGGRNMDTFNQIYDRVQALDGLYLIWH